MLGLDEKFITHSLVFKQDVKLIKQKPRKMHPATSLLVNKEIGKYIKAKFIANIDYSLWMSSIVWSQKPNREVRVCTDFRDINKACPKNDFPLPNIDMIIDSVASYEMLSFMNGFLYYNQIIIMEIH